MTRLSVRIQRNLLDRQRYQPHPIEQLYDRVLHSEPNNNTNLLCWAYKSVMTHCTYFAYSSPPPAFVT